MKMTPLDIRKQEFARTFRGFDVDEVQAFLQMLSGQWEESLSEQRRLEQRVRELESKLRHYERIEEALQEALETARESSKQALESARQKSSRIIEEAEVRSEEIKRAAERQRHDLRYETNDLIDRRNGIVARLRALLTSELEMLAHYERAESSIISEVEPVREERSRPRHVEPADPGKGSSISPPIRPVNDKPEPIADETGPMPYDEQPIRSQVNIEDDVVEIPESVEDEEGDRGEGSGWVVRPVLTTEPQDEDEERVEILPDPEKGEHTDSGKTSTSSEDFDRIRRILRDLD